jgi:hypothetical protein
LVEELTAGWFVGGRELIGGELGINDHSAEIRRNGCFRGTLFRENL